MSIKFILAALLLVAAGCEHNNQSRDKQILRLNLIDDPVSLDPRLVRSLKDLTVVKQLFEGLTRMDGEGVPQLALAESYEISEDLLTYTFHLREAFWSNQDPVTAYDFAGAWRQILDPKFASDYAYMLYPIKNAQAAWEGKCPSELAGITALDNQTLVVELKAPTPYFLELVAFPTYYPVHQQSEEHFVCNGPFCLEKWEPQSDLILKKNPLYWDHEAVHLDQIAFSIISDNNTESQLFEQNALDWLGPPVSNNITTALLGKLKEEGALCSYPVAGTFWIQFNTQKAPFDHEKLRKAFSYAINRQEIITHILQGDQSVATGPLPPSMHHNREPLFDDADIGQARQLFDEALQEIGSLPRIVVNYSATERSSKIVQLLQQQWRAALGVEVELAAMETQVYHRTIREGKYLIGTGEWIADYNDPLAFLEIFKYLNEDGTGNGMNSTFWHNENFTALLDQSLTEGDPAKRFELLLKAERILIDEMPIAPLYHYSWDYLKQDSVEDVLLSSLGLADFKTARIKLCPSEKKDTKL